MTIEKTTSNLPNGLYVKLSLMTRLFQTNPDAARHGIAGVKNC
jgi:hypothetical protein